MAEADSSDPWKSASDLTGDVELRQELAFRRLRNQQSVAKEASTANLSHDQVEEKADSESDEEKAEGCYEAAPLHVTGDCPDQPTKYTDESVLEGNGKGGVKSAHHLAEYVH